MLKLNEYHFGTSKFLAVRVSIVLKKASVVTKHKSLAYSPLQCFSSESYT